MFNVMKVSFICFVYVKVCQASSCKESFERFMFQVASLAVYYIIALFIHGRPSFRKTHNHKSTVIVHMFRYVVTRVHSATPNSCCCSTVLCLYLIYFDKSR